MIGRRPDILAGIPLRRRLEREREDGRYLANHTEVTRHASNAALEANANTWAGVDTFTRKDFSPYQQGGHLDMIIVARLDLDHPLYFPDNKFTDCADCGCNLQYRPDVPKSPGVPFLCICCAARRMRERKE